MNANITKTEKPHWCVDLAVKKDIILKMCKPTLAKDVSSNWEAKNNTIQSKFKLPSLSFCLLAGGEVGCSSFIPLLFASASRELRLAPEICPDVRLESWPEVRPER